jgi:hypothetical protein
MSSTYSYTWVETAASKLSSANGIAVTSARWNSSGEALSRPRAIASMLSLKSTP